MRYESNQHQLSHIVGKKNKTKNIMLIIWQQREALCFAFFVWCYYFSQGQCGSLSKRRRHDSEQSLSSGTSGLEYTDLEAAEVLVCMSWGQGHYLGSNRPTPCKPRPLTPASDSCDSILPTDLPEPPKDFVSLSSLVSGSIHMVSFDYINASFVNSPP